MTLGRVTAKLFTQNFSKKSALPSSASHQVLKAFQSSFKKHPSSYTPLPFDKSRISYPLKNPSIRIAPQMTKRAFSTSSETAPKATDAHLLEEALDKIGGDPRKVPEILKDLPTKLHEKLAISLLEKEPKALFPNLLLFTLEEKALIDICKKLFSSDKFPPWDKHHWSIFFAKNFKDFKFTDNDFIVKRVSFILRTFDNEDMIGFKTSFSSLGITDPKIIQDILLDISQKEPRFFLSNYKDIKEDLFHLKPDILEKLLLNTLEKLPIDHVDGGRGFGRSLMGFSTINIFAKTLPFLAHDPIVRESIALRISEKDPKSLIGTLTSLNLSPATLEKVLPKMIASAEIARQLKEIIEEFPTLEINHPHLMQDIHSALKDSILTLADQNPKVLLGNLKLLNLPEDTLREVITKIANFNFPSYNYGSLANLIEEMFSCGIQDQEFIKSIATAISAHHPQALARHLDELHLPESFLKNVIGKILETGPIKDGFGDPLIVPFYSILKRLPNLPLDIDTKKEFCEKAISIVLKHHIPDALLVSFLEPSILSKTDLKTIVSLAKKDEVNSALLKRLPSFGLEEAFFEELVIIISAKSPKAFQGLLPSLALKEEVLKQVLSNVVTSIRHASVLGGRKTDPTFLKEILQSLNINDKDFINKTIVEISNLYKSGLELKDFHFTDEKTFVEVAKNLIDSVPPEQIPTFLEEVKTCGIKDPELISSIAQCILFHYYIPSIPSNVLEILTKPNAETNLPFFVQIFKIEDLPLRKEMAKNVLKSLLGNRIFRSEDSKQLSSVISLLGLEKPGIIEEILFDVLTTQKVHSSVVLALYEDPLIGPRITPSFFLKKWDFESKKLQSTSREEFTLLEKTLNNFLSKPEIKDALSQNDLFKAYLFNALNRIDKKEDISSLQKLDALIEVCQANLDPLPPIEEITGNLILENILSSSYDYHVYTERLRELNSLGIQNPAFFEKAAIALASKNPDFLTAVLEHFNVSNTKTLEAIALQMLLKNPLYLQTYKDMLKLSKQSMLNVLTSYGAKLLEQGEWTLPPQALTEVFAQITKHRNEALSDVYLNTFLQNITSESYQKALGFYILTKKAKEDLISSRKILPAIFLAKWDAESLENNSPYRKTLSDFLGDPNIKKTLQNANKPLLQNFLLAASALDKDTSLPSSQKIKLFAQVCNLGNEKSDSSAFKIADNLRTLRFLSSLKQGSTLDYTFTKSASEELATIFKQVVIEKSLVPNLKDIENIEEKYLETFVSKAQIPGSLATYESGFRSLGTSGRNEISQGFFGDLSRFVHMCLEKTPEERYRLDINPNLQELSEKFPSVFEKWKESLPPIELESSQNVIEGKTIKDINNFISLIESELKEYEKSPLVTALHSNLKAFPKAPSSKEKLEVLKHIERDLNLLDPIPMDALKNLEKALSHLNATGSKQKVTVKDIDDPLTLFEMPTLVCQSCQNITASPAFNQCLVGYAIEGTIRMLAVQDSSGKFVARSVLRICFDEDLSPFLLLEPVYLSTKISQNEARQDIYEGAIQKAESLNIPVFTKVSNTLGSHKIIVSKGGAANMFYSDSSQGDGSHRILGKIPQELSTVLLLQMKREEFEKPTLWPKDSQK